MNMLSGIYFPDEGEVYVDGKEVTIRSPKDSFALGIGMIHQHFKLINILTAAENIILGLPGKEKLNMKQVEKEIRYPQTFLSISWAKTSLLHVSHLDEQEIAISAMIFGRRLTRSSIEETEVINGLQHEQPHPVHPPV